MSVCQQRQYTCF